MTKIDPYYYLDAPKNFFAENVDINDFKKNDRGIFQVEYRHISKEVREWFQAIGVTNIRGLIFRKNLIPRTNLHIDPNISGEEWVELCPKFVDKTVDYRPYVNQFAINWIYQQRGKTEWYEAVEGPDDIGTSPINTGWFAWTSYNNVRGPIATCYHTDNPVLYNTSIPHVPVDSIDKITVSIRPELNNNPNLTYKEVFKYFNKMGIIKQHSS